MPGKKKRITKSQSVGFYDGIEEYIAQVAKERFGGNFNAAANFVAQLGVEADKAQKKAGEYGNGQIDRTVFAEAAHA